MRQTARTSVPGTAARVAGAVLATACVLAMPGIARAQWSAFMPRPVQKKGLRHAAKPCQAATSSPSNQSCGGRIRTADLRVMSPTSCHCSTPRRRTIVPRPRAAVK